VTRYLYAFDSWALAALGALHMGATARKFHVLSSDALWFFSAGALLVVVAALNLLNRAYGNSAPGLRWVCVAANVLVLALSVVGGILTHASAAEWVIVLGILVSMVVLSFLNPRYNRAR